MYTFSATVNGEWSFLSPARARRDCCGFPADSNPLDSLIQRKGRQRRVTKLIARTREIPIERQAFASRGAFPILRNGILFLPVRLKLSCYAAESQSRYLVHNYENGALLRIEPVRPTRDNTAYECLAENGVGDAVSSEAQLKVYEGTYLVLLFLLNQPS